VILTVQISLSRLGDATTSLLLILLNDTDLLESLKNLAVYAAGSINVVRWARATIAGRPMNFSKTSNTNSLAEIDVAGDGGRTNVEPVDVLWWKLLCWAGLHGINPTCNSS